MSAIAAETATAPEMLGAAAVVEQSLPEIQKLNISADEPEARRGSEEAAAAPPHKQKDRERKRSSISMTPESFDALLISFYAETESEIQRSLADRIVRWARYSKRAMTPDELFEAIASNPIVTEETQQEGYNLNDALVEACRRLVRLDEKKSLQHFLEGAYLKQRWLKSQEQASSVEMAAANVELAKVCINYLNRPDILHSNLSRRKLKRACNAYPFLAYAMKYWRRHLLDDEEVLYPEVAPLATSLLEETPSNTLLYDGFLQTLFRLKLLHREEWATISSNIAMQPYLPPQYKLHYAIALHLPCLVEKYAQDKTLLFTRLPQGDLPLTWALRRTSKRMTRLLLRQFAREQIIECLEHADREQTALDAQQRAHEPPRDDPRDPSDPSPTTSSPSTDPPQDPLLRRSSTLMTTDADDTAHATRPHRFHFAPFLLALLLERAPPGTYNISPEFLLRHCIRRHVRARSIYSAAECTDVYVSRRVLAPSLYALHLAASTAAFVVFNYLLALGDAAGVDPAGQNILHRAVQHPVFEEARLIVDEILHLHYADPGSGVPGPGARDVQGRTILHLVRSREMLEHLLGSEDVGIDVGERDARGRAVLHAVVEGGEEVGEVRGMVEALMERGGDPEARDAEGRTVREVAVEKWGGDEVLMKLLDGKREGRKGELGNKPW